MKRVKNYFRSSMIKTLENGKQKFVANYVQSSNEMHIRDIETEGENSTPAIAFDFKISEDKTVCFVVHKNDIPDMVSFLMNVYSEYGSRKDEVLKDCLVENANKH